MLLLLLIFLLLSSLLSLLLPLLPLFQFICLFSLLLLLWKLLLYTKINKFGNKILNHDKYITTPEFNKLTAEIFAARLRQCDLVNIFGNNLTSFDKRISLNKKKHLKVQKRLNSLITKHYNFLSGRKHFTRNDGSQNMFVYQPTLDTLELKKTKVLIMFLVENQKEFLILNSSYYILTSYIA